MAPTRDNMALRQMVLLKCHIRALVILKLDIVKYIWTTKREYVAGERVNGDSSCKLYK